MRFHYKLLFGFAAPIAFTLAATAQQMPSEGPVATQATISVEAKGQAPALNPQMLKVEVNGHETPVTSVTRVMPSSAQVAILIDDGLRTSFNLQLNDIKQFITELPAGVEVGVGYMRTGTVSGMDGFSADHAAVAAKIRMPLGSPGISASPYFCVSDFVKHWPSQQQGARFVLLLTNGVDPYNGSVSPMNQDSPYVQSAQEDAQRAGVAVYAIAYGDAGMRGGAAAFSGQGYLEQVAHATGGRSFYNGTINPVSLTPFLKEFRSAIAESYTVSFMASSNHENRKTLTRVKITSSQPGIKLHAPDAVHPGEQTVE